jgi:hypothetical protein
MARLQGYEAPTVKSYHKRILQAPRGPTPHGDVELGGKHEAGCTLRGSDYSEGTRLRSPDRAVKTAPPLKTALSDALAHIDTKASILPKTVLRAVWKIEDHADARTECEVYVRGG